MPRRSHVLVVEDDDATRQLLIAALGDAFVVVGARDMVQALRWAATKPDVIVLDLALDRGSPTLPTVAQLVPILETRRLRVPPVIVLSALPDAGIIAATIGAVACFPKPFDVDALVERVRTLARGE